MMTKVPPTVCVTCVWAGGDNAWEQEKLEARKMLEKPHRTHPSSARFVGRPGIWDLRVGFALSFLEQKIIVAIF